MSKSKRKRRGPSSTRSPLVGGKPPATADGGGSRPPQSPELTGPAERPTKSQWLGKILPAAILFSLTVLYAYWPTLKWIEEAWRYEPDYSHGYLVIPLAGLLLWNRRDSMPPFRSRASVLGLSLIFA